MSRKTAMIGLDPDEVRWVRMLIALLRHEDACTRELARQALLYLTESAAATAPTEVGPRPITVLRY